MQFPVTFESANLDMQGFEADNPNIELLRLRNFTIGKRLTDKEILGEGALARVMEIVSAMVPFVSQSPISYLSSRSEEDYPRDVGGMT